jgi:hypothetical protein
MTDRHRTSSAASAAFLAASAAFLAAWDIPTNPPACTRVRPFQARTASARWCQAHMTTHTCGYAGKGKVEAVPMHVRAGLG